MYEFRSENYFKNNVDICSVKHFKDLDYNVGPHTHDFAELAYVYSGSGVNIIGGKSYPIHKGSVFFINYNQSHEIRVHTPIVQIDLMLSPRFISRELINTDNFLEILTLSQFSDLSEFTDAQFPCINLSGKEMLLAESLFDRIDDEFKNQILGFESIIRGCLQIILSIMIRQLIGSTQSSDKIPQEILDFIDKNYNERLTAEMLAEKCFYNPAYFGRVFHKCYGMSFKDYIKMRRIDEAVRLLTETDMPIESIIAQVGYTNRSEFYRVFLDQCGRTPADFRNSITNNPPPHGLCGIMYYDILYIIIHYFSEGPTMKFKRITALLLLSALLSATSCGDNSTADDTSQPDSNGTDSIETTNPTVTRKSISDDLPERDFGGEIFTVLTFSKLYPDFFIEESTGDVINDAVYKRNSTVEDRFNCKIEVLGKDMAFYEPTDFARKSILANDNDFQLLASHVVSLSGMVMQDMLMNWYDLDFVNFDKPWWSKSTVDDLTYKNKALFAIGDYALSSLSGAYCYFYDKKEAEDYNLGNLYDVVNDGKWTLNYVMDITKDIYRDLNGNNERDAYDFYGMTHQLGSSLNTYLWSCGGKIVQKDNSGEFEIVYKNEQTNRILEKVYKLIYESDGICSNRDAIYPEDSANSFANINSLAFRDGLTLMIPGTLDMTVNYFREKSNEYGILPYPKLDESQDEYYTMVDGYHAALAVPKTVSDLEFVGIITEALNAESYKTVYPAYYEVALKAKYTFDDESVQMLDKIVESRVFDFGYVYDNWKGMSFYFRSIIREEKSINLESYYAKNSASAIKYYNDLFDYFENMK